MNSFPLLREMRDLDPIDAATLPDATLDVSLLIPARNSAEALEPTVREAHAFLSKRYGNSFEIILIPNPNPYPKPGTSPDRSIEAAELLAARYPNVRSVSHLRPAGKGAALRTGFLASRGKTLFFTDADLPYDLEFFDRAADKLAAGYDLVTGNRRLPSSTFHLPVGLLRLAYKRHRLGLAFNWVARKLFPLHTTDTQAGIKAMSRRLAVEGFSRQACPGFFFDLEFFLAAAGQGFHQMDLPVTLHLHSEKSTVRVLRESVLAGYWLLRIALRQWRGCYGRPRGMESGGRLLARYGSVAPGTRFFLTARWYLTPYLQMESHLPPRGRVLDVGCGHGLLALAIALRGREREVVGVDHDTARIELAQRASHGIGNLAFDRGGMLPFPGNGTFAGIMMIDVFHYFDGEAQAALARGAFEKLGPRGTLLVREVDPHGGLAARWNRLYEKLATSSGFTQAEKKGLHFRGVEEWEEFFRSAGFRVKSERCSSFLFSDVLFICERPA